MSKLGIANLVIILTLLGGILWIESGPEPLLDSEKVFMARLHNSLWNLDKAKYQWASEKDKPEDAIPTFEDLTPYLGDWKDTIDKLKALGIEYKITSTKVNQSDVATLTRGMRFRSAVCPLYRAGTTYSVHSGWALPSASTSPISLRVRVIWLQGEFFFGGALFILLLVNALVFFLRKPDRPIKDQNA
jgi:hypothetical protein